VINKLKLIGIILVFSAILDVVIALTVLPEEVRIYLYLAGGVTAALGIVLFMRGLTRPPE
jgi:uncharacterized membrane protein HdeD (DUF308 family)